ncbi:MAG: hypothetical protein H0W72_11065, partial [Planctomycetes bacterium]|nr:hypothetical protein [Planctomycetota bacterium]
MARRPLWSAVLVLCAVVVFVGLESPAPAVAPVTTISASPLLQRVTFTAPEAVTRTITVLAGVDYTLLAATVDCRCVS